MSRERITVELDQPACVRVGDIIPIWPDPEDLSDVDWGRVVAHEGMTLTIELMPREEAREINLLERLYKL
jgi:hypothetical protein